MKKLILLSLIFIFTFSTSVFASQTNLAVEKNISENWIKVNVEGSKKIIVKGYTVKNGNNIVVNYIQDPQGSYKDSIIIDLNTVIRPYTLRLSSANESPFREPFKDIEDHYMKDYIRHLYDLGFINGYDEDDTFRPDNSITRGELFTIIVKMLDLKTDIQNRKQFADLSAKHWAYEYALKAIDNGLVSGYNENNKTYIKLDRKITIAEASKFIHEALNIKNTSSLNYDVRFVNHWAKSYIQSLLNENILSYNDKLYIDGDLNRPITRGEVVMLISRSLGR